MCMSQFGQVAYGSDSHVENLQVMGTVKNGVDCYAAVVDTHHVACQ
jgi:hypothetical protein